MRPGHFEQTINYVVLIVFAMTALTPILLILNSSLSSETIGQDTWGHFENYAKAWQQGHFSQYMRNSIVIAVIVVLSALILSIMSGYVLGVLRPPGADIIFYIFLLGIMVPSEAIVLPLYFDMRSLGMTDTIWAIALPQIAQSTAFGTFWMRSYFRAVDPAIIEAARLDGAGNPRLLWSVLMPMVILYLILQRHFIAGMTEGAVKG